MKLNTKITIESVYNESTDSNKISFSADLNTPVHELMTTLKLAESSIIDLIKSFTVENKLENRPEDTENWIKTVTLGELYNSIK